ncbi:MAG: peptidylprolyl isomerase [Alphaproteobacteria bacterium]
MTKRILLSTAALMLAFATPSFAAETAAASADPVVARVNGAEIHRSDIMREYQMMGPQAQQVPPQMLYPQLLQKMIVTKLAATQGYAQGLQNDKDVKEDLKELEAQVVAQAYVRRAIEPKITEAKIKEFYEKDVVSKYKPQDEVRARHILVSTEDEANAVIKQLKDGADFAKLAEEKSKDTGSAKSGGDLGYFPQGAMVKPFADAAFAMKAGDVSEKAVKTEFGYHVIKVEDKRKSAPPPLAQIKGQIVNQIGQDMTNDMMKSMVAKAKVEKFNIDGTPMKATAESSK